MNMRITTKVLGAALAAAALVASATAAHADLKCRETVAKESAKLTQSIAKSLQKCEQGVVDGKVTGPCPDATKAAPAITKAESKLQAAIVKKCATSTGEFTYGRCPNETGLAGTCSNILIKTKDDVGTCLSCLAEHNATELVHRVLYGSLIPAAGNKAIAGCQKAVGKDTLGFYAAKSKALAKCHDGFLKGKIPSCPDAATTAAIDKAESKKIAGITKACCGPDKVCGGATCSASEPPVICSGGSKDGKPCSPSCAGGANAGAACTVDSQCPGSTCTGSGDAQCPGGTCISIAVGDPCEAPSDCGRCRDGTTAGQPCRGNGQCQSDPGACDPPTLKCVGGPNDTHTCALKCAGGANAGASCTVDSQCPSSTCTGTAAHCAGGTNAEAYCTVASECPGGSCSSDCPSTAGGTCVGTAGFCGGIDDLSPLTQIGLPSPCPGVTLGGAPITLTGVSGDSLLSCVDTQADQRVQCQDAAGALFLTGGFLPAFCTDSVTECQSNAGTATVTVSITNATNPAVTLGGVTISLGYGNTVMIPGVNDVGSRVTNLQGGLIASSDDNATVLTSVTDFNGLSAGPLYTVQFDTCGGLPTVADFGCVVSSASDDQGHEVLDNVSCSVTSVM